MTPEGEIELIDLNSLNKTFVNSRPLEPNTPAILKLGDIVKFGKCELNSRIIYSAGENIRFTKRKERQRE